MDREDCSHYIKGNKCGSVDAPEPKNSGCIGLDACASFGFLDKAREELVKKLGEAGAGLDKAIGETIIKIAGATTLSHALIQIIQQDVLPAQLKWREVLSKIGEGNGS